MHKLLLFKPYKADGSGLGDLRISLLIAIDSTLWSPSTMDHCKPTGGQEQCLHRFRILSM